MFATAVGSKMLYTSAAAYATCTGFVAFWVALKMPVQHDKTGPYNYNRLVRRGARITERVPWRRLPKMV